MEPVPTRLRKLAEEMRTGWFANMNDVQDGDIALIEEAADALLALYRQMEEMTADLRETAMQAISADTQAHEALMRAMKAEATLQTLNDYDAVMRAAWVNEKVALMTERDAARELLIEAETESLKHRNERDAALEQVSHLRELTHDIVGADCDDATAEREILAWLQKYADLKAELAERLKTCRAVEDHADKMEDERDAALKDKGDAYVEIAELTAQVAALREALLTSYPDAIAANVRAALDGPAR